MPGRLSRLPERLRRLPCRHPPSWSDGGPTEKRDTRDQPITARAILWQAVGIPLSPATTTPIRIKPRWSYLALPEQLSKALEGGGIPSQTFLDTSYRNANLLGILYTRVHIQVSTRSQRNRLATRSQHREGILGPVHDLLLPALAVYAPWAERPPTAVFSGG